MGTPRERKEAQLDFFKLITEDQPIYQSFTKTETIQNTKIIPRFCLSLPFAVGLTLRTIFLQYLLSLLVWSAERIIFQPVLVVSLV